MSIKRFHNSIGNNKIDFDTSVTWGENLVGAYQDLPNLASSRQINYGTVLGVDTYQHVPFIKRIDTDLVITWQEGLQDEDTAGQSIKMKYINSLNVISSKFTIFEALSNSGSTDEIIVVNSEILEYDGAFYYICSVYNTNGIPDPKSWTALGVLASERLTATTNGTPFWVYTADGNAITPQSGFTAYSFNEPLSTNIANEIRSDRYQILTYLDNNVSLFDGELTDSTDVFTEISATKVRNQFIRLSRNFNFASPPQRQYFDFGDGIPIISEIPSSDARSSLITLNNNKVGLCGGTGDALSERLELFFAFADLNTLNFQQSNIYRVVSGSATGQVFAGAFKNGLWSYPNMIHDIDNKIKIVCSKYKEGIFLFEFNYSDID